MAAPQKEKFSYDQAREYLITFFAQAGKDYAGMQPLAVADSVKKAADVLFASPTQSYREALLGCGLARMVNRAINIRHPYININQGVDAFNGRTLDEQVVNPFLHDRMIPSSKDPYLASPTFSTGGDSGAEKRINWTARSKGLHYKWA